MKKHVLLGALCGIIAGCTTYTNHMVVVRGQNFIVEEAVEEDLQTGDTTSTFSVPSLAIEGCASIADCKKKIPGRLEQLRKIHSRGAPETTEQTETPDVPDTRGD